MGAGHSQTGGPDLTIASSYAPYFENAPTLGLYPTHKYVLMVIKFGGLPS